MAPQEKFRVCTSSEIHRAMRLGEGREENERRFIASIIADERLRETEVIEGILAELSTYTVPSVLVACNTYIGERSSVHVSAAISTANALLDSLQLLATDEREVLMSLVEMIEFNSSKHKRKFNTRKQGLQLLSKTVQVAASGGFDKPWPMPVELPWKYIHLTKNDLSRKDKDRLALIVPAAVDEGSFAQAQTLASLMYRLGFIDDEAISKYRAALEKCYAYMDQREPGKTLEVIRSVEGYQALCLAQIGGRNPAQIFEEWQLVSDH